MKRTADVTLALALSVLTLPILLAVAGASAWTFRSNPFFVHERVGRHGKRFRFCKIRTLPPTTGAYAAKYDLDVEALPPIMRTVRRMHLDELPQLLHVVTGRMSLVGPRPEMARLLEPLAADAAAVRASIRPGITGLWQISPACASLIHENPEYDLAYVVGRTGRLDCWILWRTVRKALRSEVVGLDELPEWALPAVHTPRPRVAVEASS